MATRPDDGPTGAGTDRATAAGAQPSVDPDSRARTHLANERTFLAWFRTGLALMALGLAAGQFIVLEGDAGRWIVRVLSTLVMLTGVLLSSVGTWRYLKGRREIEQASFRPAGPAVMVVGLGAAILGVLAIGFLWLFPV
jgi:putative membrane protein